MQCLVLSLLLCSIAMVSAFQGSMMNRPRHTSLSMSEEKSSRQERRAARAEKLAGAMEASMTPKFVTGVDIPPEISEMCSTIYDMILVERYSQPPATDTGIILPPGPEGKDRRQLAMVLAVPPEGYGLESEGGRVQPLREIATVKPGDMVYLKDPWGIGPKQIEVGERKFSFHKFAHILGVIEN